MGVYVYTLRKKTKKVNYYGNKATAQVMEFGFKPFYPSFCPSASEKRWEAAQNRQLAAADRAFQFYKDNYEGLVICDNMVYSDLRRSTWSDCNKFPARLVGFLHEDRSVREYSAWDNYTTTIEGEQRSLRQRMVLDKTSEWGARVEAEVRQPDGRWVTHKAA